MSSACYAKAAGEVRIVSGVSNQIRLHSGLLVSSLGSARFSTRERLGDPRAGVEPPVDRDASSPRARPSTDREICVVQRIAEHSLLCDAPVPVFTIENDPWKFWRAAVVAAESHENSRDSLASLLGHPANFASARLLSHSTIKCSSLRTCRSGRRIPPARFTKVGQAGNHWFVHTIYISSALAQIGWKNPHSSP